MGVAGRSRTYDTGKTVGRRRQRQHLPAGAAEAHRRDKQLRGARSLAEHRIARTRDAATQLLAAVDYVRSACSKYRAGGLVQPAIDVLMSVGDEIYRNGAARDRPKTRR